MDWQVRLRTGIRWFWPGFMVAGVLLAGCSNPPDTGTPTPLADTPPDEDTPTLVPTATPVVTTPTATLEPTPEETPTPTDTPVSTPEPTPTATPAPTPFPTPTLSPTPTPELTPSPTPKPTPTPDPDSRDQDGDSFTPQEGDCNDADSGIHPDADERCDSVDNNCDGLTDDASSVDRPTWYIDYDRDGFGSSAYTAQSCSQPLGYVANADDCDDVRATVNPDAEERCDGLDNDCDGDVDAADAADASSWYLDQDGDGYGQSEAVVTACSQPEGYASAEGDCDDLDPAYNPGAIEDDCSDRNDYNCDGSTGFADADSDGHAACEDCDDTNASINSDAQEICDQVDNDCDGLVDPSDAVDASIWYTDADGDSSGNPEAMVRGCSAPTGAVASNDDCDDENPGVNPDALERCDDLDNNCDGQTDGSDSIDQGSWYADTDGDGFGTAAQTQTSCKAPTGTVSSSNDCDDSRAQVYPGASELCDGLDNDCDGDIDEGATSIFYLDQDGDGYGIGSSTASGCVAPEGFAAQAGDCNDSDATTSPGAEPGCDGTDHDCDGQIDRDADGDGASAASCGGTDCNDGDAEIHPGATEICDGKDQDCDRSVDEEVQNTYYLDNDGDGFGNPARSVLACSAPTSDYVLVSGDCNDADAAVHPDAVEVCDTLDNNCDGIVDDGDPGIDFSSDVDHCGGCFSACEASGGEPSCEEGECLVQECASGRYDADGDPANGCEFQYNYATSSGRSGTNTCQFGTTWQRVPYNGLVELTTTGGPVLITAAKRQYKSGACERGYLSLRIDGTVIQDQDGIGIGSSWQCNASATLTWIHPLAAGRHTIELVEKTDSSSIGVCSLGATDTLTAIELPSPINVAYARGASGSLASQGGTSWMPVPYNHTVTLTTRGGPVLLLATKRQYKGGGCDARGYLSFSVDGAVFQDQGGIGVGSSWQCNASAQASMIVPLSAGSHTIRLMEKTDGSSNTVNTYGATDHLIALELEPWMNYAYARGSSGTLVTQYGTTWMAAPYNGTTPLTSENGGHLFVSGIKRQYKAGSCERGYLSLRVNGTVVQDAYSIGIGNSWHCNASAPLLYTAPITEGSYNLELVEKTDSSSIGNQTYGATDHLFAWELVPPSDKLGQRDNPASSCKAIRDAGHDLGSHAYWIQTPDGPRRLYCDMELDGGGWTLVGQVSGAYNNSNDWLVRSRNDSNLTSTEIEVGTWSSINAVPLAVEHSSLLRLSNSAVSRWVKWTMPSDRTLQTWWRHSAGATAIDAAADHPVTVSAYNGQSSGCYQNAYGIMPLSLHGGSYPAASFNTAGNTTINDWCMGVGTLLSGSSADGFTQNGNGWDAPYLEDTWPNASYSNTSPIISVWLR